MAESIRKLIRLVSYPFLRQILKLENRHLGQECYIFGDGASIRRFELSAFSDKVGIAVNTFPRHRDVRELNLRYWLVAEAGFLLPPLLQTRQNPVEGLRNRLRYQSLYRRRAGDSPNLIQITSIVNLVGLWRNQTYYFWDKLPRRKPYKNVPTTDSMFASSICAAITIAQFLGFKKAYLVGFDYTHNPCTSYHWYEQVDPIVSPQIPGTYHREFFETMMKHIKIVTVTPTPQSTELPSVDYRSLTGRKLCNRTNYELLAREDLETLALNPGFKIY